MKKFLTRILFPEREEVRVVPINSSRVSREEVPSSGWRFHLHLEAGRDDDRRPMTLTSSRETREECTGKEQ